MTEELISFDPKIEEIEKEIVSLLLNSVISLGRDQIASKILLYFLTRKNLTQKKIKQLTGFSSGKISQVVNRFVEMDLVHVIKKSSKGEIIYSIPSIELEMFTRGINLVKSNLKWEEELLEMRQDLENNKTELQKLNGYDMIRSNIQENLNRFGEYKKLLNIWEKLKKKHLENLNR
ncbi:MAG: hypothetical protein JW891_06175 [Candidatus Lokiarchaeota archaeon]|nr:hypothetical protein [Candidatus Lokiarchaeota archaeon]